MREWLASLWWPCIIVAYAIYIAAIVTFFRLLWTGRSRSRLKRTAFALAVIVVGPPIWFIFEYWVLTPPESIDTKDKLEALKHKQELARNVWAGITALALAAASYFKDRFVGESRP